MNPTTQLKQKELTMIKSLLVKLTMAAVIIVVLYSMATGAATVLTEAFQPLSTIKN